MPVTKGQPIKKVTADNIVGVINDFNAVVVDAAHSKVQYHSGNYPVFSGKDSGQTNLQALPTDHLAANTKTSMTSISGTTISAATLWESMLSITRSLVKIRKFTTSWIHRDPNTTVLGNTIATITGYGVFNTAYPTPPGSGTLNGDNVASQVWERSGATSITLNPEQTIKSKESTLASTMNSSINNCYNAWVTNCYNGNVLTYSLYTCHSNCHSNWGNARGRR